MKKLISSFMIFALCSVPVLAMNEKECPPTPPASADLERVKGLAGKWEGTTITNGKEEKAASEYKVTSGGSAVVETLFPGTPHEMVSVYHDKSGKLSMTHYCMLGNQPELELQSVSAGKMSFDMSTDSHKTLAGQMHMHSLTVDASVPGQIIQTWTAMGPDGKPMDSTVITLKKVT